MKTIRYENLIDSNTGNTVEIEVPDDFDENNPTSVAAGERGKAFAKRINKVVVAGQLREVESLEEVGKLGSDSAARLLDMFRKHGFGNE